MGETQPELKSLAERRCDGQLITLWWVKGTMDTYVEVVDLNKQPPAVTEVPVVPPASPNDVFKRPFKYMPEPAKS